MLRVVCPAVGRSICDARCNSDAPPPLLTPSVARYDITAWLDRHPGGKRVLLYTAGRDVTEIFQSYHSQSAEKVLDKYKIGVASSSEFPTLKSTPFFSTLKTRVDGYLRQRRADLRSPNSMLSIVCCLPFLVLACHFITVYLASSSVRDYCATIARRYTAPLQFECSPSSM